jgi:hypothetical protein
VITSLPLRDRYLSQRTICWLIPILLTVHNAEEAIAFHMMHAHSASLLPSPFGALEARLSPAVVLQALTILSVLAFAIAAVVAVRPRRRVALWLLLALEAAIGINAAAHVASALLLFHGYGPGLVSAVLINAPFAVYVFRRAGREAWIGRFAWRMLPVGGIVLHGPVLLGALWLAAR